MSPLDLHVFVTSCRPVGVEDKGEQILHRKIYSRESIVLRAKRKEKKIEEQISSFLPPSLAPFTLSKLNLEEEREIILAPKFATNYTGEARKDGLFN